MPSARENEANYECVSEPANESFSENVTIEQLCFMILHKFKDTISIDYCLVAILSENGFKSKNCFRQKIERKKN